MSAFLFKHPGGATSIRHALRLRPAEARSGREWKQHVAAVAALLTHEESYTITSLTAIDDNIFLLPLCAYLQSRELQVLDLQNYHQNGHI